MTEGRFLAGVGAARIGLRALTARPPGGPDRWQRSNFRDEPVSLLSGPALAVSAGLASTSPLPALLAGVGAGVIGAYDDAVGASDEAKGLRGHLGAIGHGRLTAGTVKLLGIPAVGVLAAATTGRRRPLDLLLGGAVVAGSANLLNLLDLRPGRALKAGIAAGTVLGEPGIVGSCAALLPGDLGERTMLGDAGANALGAVLGVAVITRLRFRAGRAVVLGGLMLLTGASERVSFSAVIDGSPVLHRLDRLGRRP